MTRDTHLTEHERYHIYRMNKQQCTLTKIAEPMGRSKSPSAVKLNAIQGAGYRYQQAHHFAQLRHKGSTGNPVGRELSFPQ